MAEIDVTQLSPGKYRVTVEEEGSSTVHEVTVDDADLDDLPEGLATDELVTASFRFLLDREPKESILPRFDLSVISRYFPEYRQRIGGYL